MARFIGLFALIGAIVAAALGSAAALGPLNDVDIAAGNAAVSSCDTNGVDVDYVTHLQAGGTDPIHFEVQGVDVSGFEAACEGKYVLIGLDMADGSTVFASSGLDNCSFSPIPGGAINSSGEASLVPCSAVDVEDIVGIAVMVKSTAS